MVLADIVLFHDHCAELIVCMPRVTYDGKWRETSDAVE